MERDAKDRIAQREPIEQGALSAEDRHAEVRALRQARSVPLLEQFKERLEEARQDVLPRSGLGSAVSYVLNQWEDLCRFAEDGAIPIDNNALERQIRTVAVGRRNWTFCGSEAGGAWAARLYGLLGTCRLQGVNPYAWLKDVISRVRRHPADRMHELTPRGWRMARENSSS